MRKILLVVVLTLFTASSARAESFPVGYSPKFLKDDFQVLLLKALQKGIAARGWTLAGAPDANGNVEKQVSDLENLLAGGAKALILVPYDGAGVVPAIKKANAANIPVFCIDDGPSGGKVVATVRADNVNAGAQGAEEMVRRLKKSPKWPKVTVLELQGGLLTVNGRDRTEGFYGTMKKLAPNVKVIQRPTDWTADKAADATQNVLTQTPDLDGVFMASELMAAAVNARLREAGRGASVGDPKAVIRVAIDGTPAGLDLIRKGALDATVSQPLSGYAEKTLDLAQLTREGKSVKVGEYKDGRVIMTDVGPQYQLYATLVTAKNVNDPSLWGNAK